MIELTTLGRVSVARDGQDLPRLAAHKQKFALLVYLALEGPVARDRLLALFWPDRDEERARHSLSQALYSLRQELDEECLHATSEQVRIDRERVRLDSRQLEAAAEEENWEAATELYGGAFLDGFHLPGAPGFEDWSSRVRARLARLGRTAFAHAVQARADADDLAAAVRLGTRWAALQPLEDEAQHTLIALLAATGDRAGALRRYEEYRERLARELDVEPLDHTVALVERVRAGEQPEFRSLRADDERDAAVGVEEDPEEDVSRVRELEAFYDTQPATRDGAGRSRSGGERLTRMLGELRDRRVLQVGLLYLGVSWVAVQVAASLKELGMLPEWVPPVLMFFLAVGLPIALIMAWAQAPAEALGPAEALVSSAEALTEDRLWPRWMESVRAGHLLAVLAVLILAGLAGMLLLERGSTAGEGQRIEAAAALDPTRIAVLYFDDLSEDGSLGYLADGFTDELITRLDEVESLELVSLNGVKQFRDVNAPLDSIARVLQAGTLVTGTVMASADRLRVSVQLIDATSRSTLASQRLERPRGEPLELVADLGDEVSRWLREQLGVEIRERERRAATRSDQTWELVQRADELKRDAGNLRMAGDTAAASEALARADSMLARAESLDPQWVEPIVLRGWIARDRANYLRPTPGAFAKNWLQIGIEHAERALELDPESPNALELRGTLRYRLWKQTTGSAGADTLLDAAERDLRRAVGANPTHARAWATLSELLHEAEGKISAARVAARRAYEADAFLENTEEILYRLYYIALEREEYQEALQSARELQRRFPENVRFPALELATLASEGPEPDVSRAWALAERIDEVSAPDSRPDNVGVAHLQVAAVLARAGRPDSSRKVMQRILSDVPEEKRPFFAYDEAHVRLLLDQPPDTVLDLLALYLEHSPQDRAYLAGDHWFRELHDHPGFQQLVQPAE